MHSSLIDKSLLEELQKALAKIDGYGSVELYIQKNKVTQITARNIQKTASPIRVTNGQ
jgi:hypothetical protein